MSEPPNDNSNTVDNDGYFHTRQLEHDLKARTVRAGFIVLGGQACKLLLTFVSIAVLARLLSPDEFGVVAMVAAATGFVGALQSFGLASSTVQRAQIDHSQVSTLFWVNVGIGVAAALLITALAPVLSWFYDDHRLSAITWALASVFILNGLTVQHQALLRRQMRFAPLAAVQVVSVLIAVAVGITLALFSAGYWALVSMEVAKALTTAVGVWLVCNWRPGRPVRGAGVRSMLLFGGTLTGANLLKHVERNLDDVLIGWSFGAGTLGLYSKAYQLLRLPVQQVNAPLSTVAIATLSRLQNDNDRYRLYYREAIQLIVSIGMPVVALMFVSADKVILGMLGSQWIESVAIFRVLAPAAMLGTFNVATIWVYISLGRADRRLRWGIVSTVVMAIAFVVGLQWGVMGVAAACSIGTCALRAPGVVYCFRGTPVKVSDLLGVLWRPALASTVSGLLLFAAQSLITIQLHPLVGLLGDAVLYSAFYLLLWATLPNGRKIMGTTVGLLKNVWCAPREKAQSAN